MIELLVILAIIGVLVGMLLPALQQARSAARRAECQNHLKQVALAALHHHDVRGRFPAGFEQRQFGTAPVYRGVGLFASLMPYWEQGAFVAGWNRDDPLLNTVGGDAAPTARVLSDLLCPDDPLDANPVMRGTWVQGLSSYGGNGGTRVLEPGSATTDGIFHTGGPASEPRTGQKGVRIKEILDGTSHTLLLGERHHRDANYQTFVDQMWADALTAWGWWGPCAGRTSIGHVALAAESGVNYSLPFDYAGRAAATPPAGSIGEFQYYTRRRLTAYGSGHAAGANFAHCDGSVHFVADSIAPQILIALATRAASDTADE